MSMDCQPESCFINLLFSNIWGCIQSGDQFLLGIGRKQCYTLIVHQFVKLFLLPPNLFEFILCDLVRGLVLFTVE